FRSKGDHAEFLIMKGKGQFAKGLFSLAKRLPIARLFLMASLNFLIRTWWLLILASSLAASAQPFELLVTQSPPGPSNQNPATWSGILQYHFTDGLSTNAPAAGVDKSLISDPAGLVYRGESSEVFVGNRHGNVNPSSITRFK